MENVGQTIFTQLTTLGGTIVWCWGAHAYKSFSDKYFTDISHLGGLLFKLNGHIHKGHVMIRLAPNDTYTISIGTFRNNQFTSKKDVTDVYFDQMVEIIDGLVETKSANAA
jgi:hypothetical protein